VPPKNERAADEAIATMARLGLDISRHRPTPINKVVVDEYEFVLALDKDVYRTLLENGVRSLRFLFEILMGTTLVSISAARSPYRLR
jgi:protein-tyrosine-phosphatase